MAIADRIDRPRDFQHNSMVPLIVANGTRMRKELLAAAVVGHSTTVTAVLSTNSILKLTFSAADEHLLQVELVDEEPTIVDEGVKFYYYYCWWWCWWWSHRLLKRSPG